MFRYVIENDLMPPWYLDPNTGPWRGDISLTGKEKATLLKWIDSTMEKKTFLPKKSLKLLIKKNKALKKKNNRNKSPADYILSLPEKVVVSKGFGRYKKFFFKTSFKEDKWIEDIEFILKPKVIHHSFFLILDKSFNKSKKDSFSVYKHTISHIDKASGKYISKNVGFKIPKNSIIMWEIHYEPFGKEIIDEESKIKIKFNKNPPKSKLISLSFLTKKINIPPHQSDYQIKMSHRLTENVFILGMATHMHLRGKLSTIFIIDPEGKKKKIFEINPWNVKFEKGYMFKKPLMVSKGSRIECINYFDNSENNLWNPAPEKYVTYGDLIEDEMSFCRFKLLYPSNSKARNLKVYF